MATLNYYLDKRSIKKDGTHPLKLSINTKENSFLLSTEISLKSEQWDPKQNTVIKHKQKVFLNAHLSAMLTEAEQILLAEKQKKGKALTKLQMKTALGNLFKRKQIQTGEVENVFMKFINDSSKAKRTQEIYEATWNKIKAYTADSNSLSFSDIDVKWLKSFNEWMTPDCPTANARAIHFRNLRAVFNEAIDDEITTNYPFRKFKIEHEKTRKRALTVKQLQELRDMSLKKWQKKYVDCFFLMIYLLGINGIDLLSAKPKQIVNGRLEYKRAKTGTLYSVKIEPEALDIINRYKGEKYILKFCDNRKSYRTFMDKLNKCLKDLIPGCTSYYARHTVASIAAELDIPMDTIARMLGHNDSTKKITLIYVDFDQKKVDKANRKIINYITSK